MKYSRLSIGFFCLAIILFSFSNCKKDDEKPNTGCVNNNIGQTVDQPLTDCANSMIGQPVEATGLSNQRCKPSCECWGFTSKNFTPDQLNGLLGWQLVSEFDELTENPYESMEPQSNSMVCAMIIEDMANKLYSLASFSSVAAAEASCAILTHYDACGVCSTLTDFVAYAKDRDVGAAVRNCGLQNLSNFDSLVSCLQDLGFTKPCAQIWGYNTYHTRDSCFSLCLPPPEKYHNEDGTLNPCLECDERISGPVFKAVAGRTRRNTGLASSICRFCNEIKPVEHNYPF